MELSRRQGLIALTATAAIIGALLLIRLSAFGIWDPWELSAADNARSLLDDGETVTGPPLSAWLVALAFKWFGIREWTGRLPIALLGLCSVLISYGLVARFAGRRAGIYSAIVAGTSPLFLFNSRQILGESAGFAAQALVAGLAAVLAFGDKEDEPKIGKTLALFGGLIVAVTLSVLSSGALMGPLPPLLAVSTAAIAVGRISLRPWKPKVQAGGFGVLLVTVVTAFFVVTAIFADRAEYSPFLGGKPLGVDPPTFDAAMQTVFHSFAPWSAFLLVALGRMLYRPGDETRRPLELVLVLWAAFSYGALTVFTSRYGTATYLAVVALSGAVGIFLRDLEQSKERFFPEAVISLLFVGLIARDYALYPSGPTHALAVQNLEVPDVFNPKIIWASLLGAFGLATAFGMFGHESKARFDFRAPYRFLRAQWQRGIAEKIWLALVGLLAILAIVASIVARGFGEQLRLTTLVIKWGGRLGFIPILAVVAIHAGQLFIFLANKANRFRTVPILVAGLAFSVYTAQFFLPSLSTHLSPRKVYDTFNRLAGSGAELGEYNVGARAADYYTTGTVKPLDNHAELVRYLTTADRKWAVFPADELARVDSDFRKQTNRHLFIPDASSARVLLATNQPVDGVDNENVIEKYVLSEPPDSIDHKVSANFQDKIELVGYDLDLPHEGYVGAGEKFTVTWYWRSLAKVPGSYQVFLHVDGAGLRLNGDHEPVDGKYPVRLWEPGDVIVDKQTLTVPANYRPGPYTFFIGFFSGNNRLSVTSGKSDSSDRAIAGTLTIR